MLSDWSKLILVEKSEIVASWVKQIKSLKGSYASASDVELSDSCAEFLDAFTECFDRGHFINLLMFVEKLSRLRSAQGFRLSEVQRAYYSFYGIIKPIVRKQQARGRFKEDALDKIHSIVIDTLFELSEAYYKRLNEKIEAYLGNVEVAQRDLRAISTKDELTGCFTHRYFHDFFDSEISRSKRYDRPLSLVMFDIDHFQKCNNEYGKLLGDDVLKAIGELLRKSIRSCDTAFRYGPEEFSIILPETKQEKALSIAERIRKKLESAPLKIRDQLIAVTISGGVSSLDKKSLNKDDFIANVNKALDTAKKKGRNQVMPYHL